MICCHHEQNCRRRQAGHGGDEESGMKLFERFRDEKFPESCLKAMKQGRREQRDRSERQQSVAFFLRPWRRQEFQPECFRNLQPARDVLRLLRNENTT